MDNLFISTFSSLSLSETLPGSAPPRVSSLLSAITSTIKDLRTPCKKKVLQPAMPVVGGAGDCWRKLFRGPKYDDLPTRMPADVFLSLLRSRQKQLDRMMAQGSKAQYVAQMSELPSGDMHVNRVDIVLDVTDRTRWSPNARAGLNNEELISFVSNRLSRRDSACDFPTPLVGASHQYGGYSSIDRVQQQIQGAVSDLAPLTKRIPLYNTFKSEGQQMVSEVYRELPLPRLPQFHLPGRINTAHDTEQEQVIASSGFVPMDKVSAYEAAKVLNSSVDVLGDSSERLTNAQSYFSKGIRSSVPPSDPNFGALTRLVGPLVYSTNIEAHGAAGTIRRAAMAHMRASCVGAVVGLVSPSNAECHAFPNGVYWFYDDGGLDQSRRKAHCTLCKQPKCAMIGKADIDGRSFYGNNQRVAAATFQRFSVQVALFVNVEPNLHAKDLLKFLVDADVFKAYSLVSFDWRAIVSKVAHDELIGMTTEQVAGQVISSFDDAGDYVQKLENCRALFRPTYTSGHALRRTVVFHGGASNLFEISVSNSRYAGRCVPGYENSYFIRVELPGSPRACLVVEKKGFDRVLATYRTQAVKNIDTARIVLRQSNVTYSISGTAVTPRMKLSGTEAEALACWIVVYSQLQDTIGQKSVEAMSTKSSTTLVKDAIWKQVATRLSATTGGVMALGSASTVDALLNAYRRDMQELTLDDMSRIAFEEHFGTKIDILDALNVFEQAWSSLWAWAKNPGKLVNQVIDKVRDAWSVSFRYVDMVMLASLLGLRFTVTMAAVVLDFGIMAMRMAGNLEAETNIRNFKTHVTWGKTKTERFWVGVQESQNLDFQAATIDIVETFYNVFSYDPAIDLQKAREDNLLDDDVAEAIEKNANLPYSDFLSEVKLFLGNFNCHASRMTAMYALLSHFQTNIRHADPKQVQRMIHAIKESATIAALPMKQPEMTFSLGDKPTLLDLPLRPLLFGSTAQDIRKCHAEYEVLRLTPKNSTASTLERLRVVDGAVDFSPIHMLMEEQHPNGLVNQGNLHGPSFISPDEKGTALVNTIIKFVATLGNGAAFTDQPSVQRWYQVQMADKNMIAPVKALFERSVRLGQMRSVTKWIAHIDGCAFGGKSKSIRSLLNSQDLVIVPTNELRSSWEAELGKMDPVFRATVITQHQALDNKFAARYVIVDEAYQFDLEHLQALMNRQAQASGLITIGDGRQVGNVFTQTEMRLDPNMAPAVMVTPVSFAPWDSVAIYLETTVSPIATERYFCGSNRADGLKYTISGSDVLVPGDGDLVLQGTQRGKAVIHGRNLPTCSTVHEAQGSRGKNTIVHCAGAALQADLHWLGKPEQTRHMAVLITRSGISTTFVVSGIDDLKAIQWVDQGVRGCLPKDCLYSGTMWDLVEPRTQDDATIEYIKNLDIPETHLDEVPLTDPISVGTIFVGNEALSSSEIRVNVELSGSVRFQDVSEPHSDNFDDYTLQPRSIPGADKVQALSRTGDNIEVTHQDFVNANKIVELLFEQVIDKKKFFAHACNSRNNVLARRERDQVVDGCYAGIESRMSTTSFAFLKPEFAKKESQLGEDGELKAQGVITASDMQQALFMDLCDSLTHAWARSMKHGKFSPVGMCEEDVAKFLGSFERSYELDITKQDHAHRPVHVLVAGLFMAMVADKLGLSQVAFELRSSRNVRMMNGPFAFLLSWALASGDPWTLVINKIMAWSSLVSVADVSDVRACQHGDDITLDRQPVWYSDKQIENQAMANKGLKWKVEEREQRKTGVTFISRAVLPNQVVVNKALRTILKYSARKRDRLQHEGIMADVLRIKTLTAKTGLQAYAEARHLAFGGDPVVIFDLWTRALVTGSTPFDLLPPDLRNDSDRGYTIRSRDEGCFGYALAYCVDSNVKAINAIAKFRGATPTLVAMEQCRLEKVPYIIMDESWANRSRARLQTKVDSVGVKRSFVVLYRDHAVAVVPSSVVLHSSIGKRVIKWSAIKSGKALIEEF